MASSILQGPTYIYACNVLNGLQDQVTTKLKSSLGDSSGRVRITFIANFLYFLSFTVAQS